jgi:hypothetical protein
MEFCQLLSATLGYRPFPDDSYRHFRADTRCMVLEVLGLTEVAAGARWRGKIVTLLWQGESGWRP